MRIILLLMTASILANTHAENKQDVSCTLTGNSVDNVSTVKKSCTDIVVEDLTVPAGVLLDLTGLQQGTTLTFKGTLKFDYYEWEGNLMSIGGTNINVIGADGHVIDGQGALYWDGLGGKGKTKPKFIKFTKMYDSVVTGLNVLNTPKNCFSITNSRNLTLDGITLDNRDGDVTNGGHNTDAFDVGNSDYIYIKNSVVYNQDDCLAVNSGTNYFFINNYCSGGHGISIGSVGGRENNDIENIYVQGCTIVNSDNGVRIKTIYNTTGLVNNITYKDITLENINKFGITIRGDYPNNNDKVTTGIPITNLVLENIHGTVKSTGVNINVYVADGVASNWSWKDINVTGGKKTKSCLGIPANCGATCS